MVQRNNGQFTWNLNWYFAQFWCFSSMQLVVQILNIKDFLPQKLKKLNFTFCLFRKNIFSQKSWLSRTAVWYRSDNFEFPWGEAKGLTRNAARCNLVQAIKSLNSRKTIFLVLHLLFSAAKIFFLQSSSSHFLDFDSFEEKCWSCY